MLFLAHFFYPKLNNQNLMSCSKFLKRHLQLFFTAKLTCWSELFSFIFKSFNHFFFCSWVFHSSETFPSDFLILICIFLNLYILCYTTFKILSNHFIYKPYSWKTLNRHSTADALTKWTTNDEWKWHSSFVWGCGIVLSVNVDSLLAAGPLSFCAV